MKAQIVKVVIFVYGGPFLVVIVKCLPGRAEQNWELHYFGNVLSDSKKAFNPKKINISKTIRGTGVNFSVK